MTTSMPYAIKPTFRPGTAGAESRQHARLDLEIEVSIGSDHNFFTGFTQNISEGGIFVATQRIVPVGTRLALSFTLPGEHRPVDVVAEVRWVKDPRDTDDASRGLGLRFVEISPLDLVRVQDFIELLREPLFYDD